MWNFGNNRPQFNFALPIYGWHVIYFYIHFQYSIVCEIDRDKNDLFKDFIVPFGWNIKYFLTKKKSNEHCGKYKVIRL